MPTFVYIMSCNGAMKIGKADNPEKRVKDLQTGSATPIKLVDSYRIRSKGFARYVEKRAHKHLADIHMSGEWFEEDISRAQETIQGVITANSK